jgi:AraC-like DNA-binding protein
MLGIFIVQLPFSVCAVWCLLILLKRHKSLSDRLAMWVMGLLAVSFYCGSVHMDPSPNYYQLAVCEILQQFSTLSVFPIIFLYIKSCYEESEVKWYSYLFTLPSLFLTGMAIILTAVIGLDRCAIISEIIHNTGYNFAIPANLSQIENLYVLFVFQIYFVLYFISLCVSIVCVFSKLFAGKFKFKHLIGFLRGQKSSFVANVICFLFVIYFVLWGCVVIFGQSFMNSQSVIPSLWSLGVAIILFLVGYVSAIPALPGGYINLDRMRHPFTAMNQSTQEFLQGIDSGPMAGVVTSGYDKIMDSFKQYMVKEQGFLNPSLTIEEISRVLNTNRTYVSKLVNLYYGMPFRDYLNKLRMDYAKQLLKDEPDASLDYIAVKSGFQSSTQFIRKFREIEGITPTVWKGLQRQQKS